MSSAYWLEMARGAKRTEMILKEKKAQLQNYLGNLHSLNSQIFDAFNYAQNAENDYSSGGYICEGETLDKGTLNNCYSVLQTDGEVITNVINKLMADIEELGVKILQAQNDYQVYMSNYYAALEEERRQAEEEAARAAQHHSGKF